MAVNDFHGMGHMFDNGKSRPRGWAIVMAYR